MIKLHPTLLLNPRLDEPPASYLSSVARRIGRAPESLAREIGTDFKKIVHGEPDAMSLLIDGLGLPKDAFSLSAIVKVGREHRIGAEYFPPHAMRRSGHHICPICVRDDLGRGEVPRAQVLPGLIVCHACPEHHCLYVPVRSTRDSRMHYDFGWHVNQALKNGMMDKEPDYVTADSGPMSYLWSRICGERSSVWFDHIPAFTAVRFAEVLGLEMMFREVKLMKNVTAAEWHEAGRLGFETLCRGKQEIPRALARIRETRKDDFMGHTWREALRNLHDFVARGNRTYAGLEDFRQVMHDCIVETVPVGKGDIVFGLPVKDRKIHSLKSASAEYGVTSKTLKKRLRAIGANGPISAGPSDSVVLFEATGLETQLREIENAITKRVALKYLGLKATVGETIFSAGLIPHVHLPGAKGSRAKAYLQVDLDAFVARLRINATIWDGDETMHPVPRAVGRARTPLNRIVQMILSGQISRVAYNDLQPGLLSILVDPKEVKAITHAMPTGIVTVPTAANLLDINYPLFSKMVRAGIIPHSTGRSPVCGQIQRLIEIRDLDAFAAEYISLLDLSADMKVHPLSVNKLMKQRGVGPAFKRPQIPATFYRRTEVGPYPPK